MPLRRANKYFNTVFNRGHAHTCAHTFRPLATAVEHCCNAHSPKIIITIIIIHSTRGTTHTHSQPSMVSASSLPKEEHKSLLMTIEVAINTE